MSADVIWSRVPIFHPDIVPDAIAARIEQDGLWGFTGSTPPPPSSSTLHEQLSALAEWGVTEEKMIRSPRCSIAEQALIKRAGWEVNEFVKRRWNEDVWETAWFVNPVVSLLQSFHSVLIQRLQQSVPGLAHFHVFARQKAL